MTDRFPR